MTPDSRPWPLRLRNWLIPDALGEGWMPFAMLGYLLFLFLFLPFVLQWGKFGIPLSLGATLLSVACFLALYFAAYRSGNGGRILCAAAILAIACVLFRWNGFSNNYVVYAVSFLASLRAPLWQRAVLAVAAIAIFSIVLMVYPVNRTSVFFILMITTMISTAVFFGVHFQDERDRQQAQLLLTQDEVRRVAAFAERERIGRDLHDLLGPTLSTVALKAELAGKLVDRDAAAAKREIDEVATIAREALSQVRTAVAGIRSAVIAAELASAKVLLEAAGVRVHADIGEIALPTQAESALAMTLREAATNIERHARASEADIRLRCDDDGVELSIQDNGRGGALRAGNGLSGMRERLEALGGSLRVDGRSGTVRGARLPAECLA